MGSRRDGDIWSVCMCFMQSYEKHILYCQIGTHALNSFSVWSLWNEISYMYSLKSSLEKGISDVLYFDLLWCKLKFCSECPINFVTEN